MFGAKKFEVGGARWGPNRPFVARRPIFWRSAKIWSEWNAAGPSFGVRGGRAPGVSSVLAVAEGALLPANFTARTSDCRRASLS